MSKNAITETSATTAVWKLHCIVLPTTVKADMKPNSPFATHMGVTLPKKGITAMHGAVRNIETQ